MESDMKKKKKLNKVNNKMNISCFQTPKEILDIFWIVSKNILEIYQKIILILENHLRHANKEKTLSIY